MEKNIAEGSADAPGCHPPQSEVLTVDAKLTARDRFRHWGYRWGLGRMHAAVSPGLYRVGTPDRQSPVLISANYRMSFDVLRSSQTGRSAWILVLDTKGINVWCAAGKGTFGTEELIKQIGQTMLQDVVSHRRVVVPQLGAPGVAAHLVKKATGFTIVYGPVRARDLPQFLENGKATPAMRRVTFKLDERLAVVPVEVVQAFWPLVGIALVIALAAGWRAGLAYFLAAVSAAVAVPAFHNWLPGTWLSVKGVVWGLIASGLAAWSFSLSGLPLAALLLSATSSSAYLALNFTGSTTYTPVNGVKREMRRMLPAIISTGGLGLIGWVTIVVRRLLA